MQLGADGLPGDVVVGRCQRLTRAPLDFAGPRSFHVRLRFAVQAGEQVSRQRSTLGYGQVHRFVQ